MRRKLLIAEVIRFLIRCLIFGVVALVFYSALTVGIWVANKIHDGRCMANFSLGGTCIIDSLLLTIMATAGLTIAFALLSTAFRTVKTFLRKMERILTYGERELPLLAKEIDSME